MLDVVSNWEGPSQNSPFIHDAIDRLAAQSMHFRFLIRTYAIAFVLRGKHKIHWITGEQVQVQSGVQSDSALMFCKQKRTTCQIPRESLFA
jgi:hypothetical protein